jgi:DNA polymerase III sliding clamp (beta) subunit (PCNA family)
MSSFGVAVEAALPGVSTSNVTPVLSNLKCTAHADGTLTVQATDLISGILYLVSGATVEEPGACILQSQSVSRIVREHRGDNVSVHAGKNDSVVIRIVGPDGSQDGAEYELSGFDPTTFPDSADLLGDAQPVAVVTAGDLRRMVARTRFAIAKDKEKDSHYDFRAPLIEVRPATAPGASDGSPRVLVVCTDGTRLGLAECVPSSIDPAIEEGKKAVGALASLRALDLCLSALADDGEAVKLYFTNALVVCETPTTTVFMRQVEARFPPYQQFFPKAHDGEFRGVSEFFAAARRASFTVDGEAKRVDVEFGPVARFVGVGETRGRSEITAPLADWTGPAMKFGLAHDYLEQMNRAFGKEPDVVVQVSQKRPMVFRYPQGMAMLQIMPEPRGK